MRPSTAQKDIVVSETTKQDLEKESEKQENSNLESKSKLKKRAPHMTFRQGTSQARIKAVIAQHIHLLRQAQWIFNDKEFKERKITDVLANAKTLLIYSLTLNQCKHSSILKEISQISFPKMTILNLSGNKITSIEQLQHTHLPVLDTLILSDNLLTSLRSLRKCNFILQILRMYNNKVISMDGLQQLNLSSLIEMMWGNDNPIVLTWSLVKLQINSRKLGKVWFHHEDTLNLKHYLKTFDLLVLGKRSS